MKDALENFIIKEPKVKFINNVEGAIFVSDVSMIKKLLVDQVKSKGSLREHSKALTLNLGLYCGNRVLEGF